MRRVSSKDDVSRVCAEVRADGCTIGLVPTMGALHDGHLALVRAARAQCDFVCVSVFVNPLQFGASEDLGSYPRDLDTDARLLAAEDVDLLFSPGPEEMYAPSHDVMIDPGALGGRWEGEQRPGHFAGVATVVVKLFGLVGPDRAFFGEKDYQQLKIVQKVVSDLDMGVAIEAVPTVRDADGLALSSRNAYLGADERRGALALSRALRAARQLSASGERDAHELEKAMRGIMDTAVDRVVVEYAAVVDAETLEPLAALDRSARAIIAAKVGSTRLIDNVALDAAGGRR
ncbi:MAG: pantoate--beta-alanine ligase [Coriobacteriia bacterium]|nr:pantoate--beta-alanine ligase [Coriobacteriia bacterium]